MKTALQKLYERLAIVAPRQGWELYIVGSHDEAARLGFRPNSRDRRHPQIPAIYWSVGMDPAVLRGSRLCRVTVSDFARRRSYAQGRHAYDQFLEACDCARFSLREEPAVWMEF